MFRFLLVLSFVRIGFSLVREETDECRDILERFSSSIADFTKCSVEHARPVSVCGWCVDDYISILNNYDNLTKTRSNDSLCIDTLRNFDRLDVVESFKNNVDDFWKRAQCNDCFAFENGTLTNQPSRFKKEFEWRRINYTACLSWYHGENQTKICQKCMDTYVELQNYYSSIGNLKAGIEGLCMDIVDWMNSTQLFWSENCCKYRRHNEYTFIFLTSVACFLPILYYLSARYFGIIRKTTILSQTRFAESLNAQSQSEISNPRPSVSSRPSTLQSSIVL